MRFNHMQSVPWHIWSLFQKVLQPGRRKELVLACQSADAVLERAKGMAFLIHGDDQIADYVLHEALLALDTFCTERERYWKKRTASRLNLQTLNTQQNLQQVVFLISRRCEEYQEGRGERSSGGGDLPDNPDIQERLEERAGLLNEQELLIRYVACLTSDIMARGAVYSAVGVTKLVFGYEFREMGELYQGLTNSRYVPVAAALQGKENPHKAALSDIQCSEKKMELMKRLVARFSEGVIQRSPARKGEPVSFIGQEQKVTEPLTVKLVLGSLHLFTPWGLTRPPLELGHPPRLDFTAWLERDRNGAEPPAWGPGPEGKEFLNHLQSWIARAGNDEIARTYALVNPLLLCRLTQVCRLEAPFRKLSLPAFFLNQLPPRKDKPMSDTELNHRLKPQPVDSDRHAEQLEEAAHARSLFRTGRLVIRIDGREQAEFGPAFGQEFAIEINPATRLVQIVAKTNGEHILLASLLLDPETFRSPERKPKQFERRLENGAWLVLALEPATPATEAAPETCRLKVVYQPDSSLRSPGWFRIPAWGVPVTVGLLVTALVLLVWLGLFKHPTVPLQVNLPQPSPSQPAPEPKSLPDPKEPAPQEPGPQPPVQARPAPLLLQTGSSELENRYWALVRRSLDRKKWKVVTRPSNGTTIVSGETLMGGTGVAFTVEVSVPGKGQVWASREEINEANLEAKATALAERLNRLPR